MISDSRDTTEHSGPDFDAVMREALEAHAHEIPAELDGAQVTQLSENGSAAVYAVTLNGGEPIEVTISEREGQHFYQVPGRKPSHGYVSREHALAGAIRKMRGTG